MSYEQIGQKLTVCYVVARVVQKAEMARNVWKHLVLLVSPKSTEEKQGELVDLHSL